LAVDDGCSFLRDRRRYPLLVRALIFLLIPLVLAGCKDGSGPPQDSRLILWAWERPEDLRFAPDAEVALQVGFVEIAGDNVRARGRRFPLTAVRPPETLLVHVQIDHGRPLAWTPALRARVAAAVRHYASAMPAGRVQLDFEVRESERPVLLDVLRDLRRALPSGTLLSMTALASWCMYEDWLSDAPVDEIVPMLFRMQKGGEAIAKTLAEGGDFRHPRCRAALAISTDSPILRAPPGRRVYLFNPRSWTSDAFRKARHAVEAW
jgi:hypothetical protein